MLAIVGLSGRKEVVAMLVAAGRPESAVCRTISSPGETAASPPSGTPSVLWTGERFVAAWLREDGTVRACELRNLRSAPVVVDIGYGADVERPLRQLVHNDGEFLTFIWRERGSGFTTRQMPGSLGGYTAVVDLWRWFSARLQFDTVPGSRSRSASF